MLPNCLGAVFLANLSMIKLNFSMLIVSRATFFLRIKISLVWVMV